MTTPMPEFRRGDFERLLDEHRRLIELANDVEFCLHALSSGVTEENLRALQQSTGTLVSVLRNHLFRQDQHVLPLVDAIEDGRIKRGTGFWGSPFPAQESRAHLAEPPN